MSHVTSDPSNKNFKDSPTCQQQCEQSVARNIVFTVLIYFIHLYDENVASIIKFNITNEHFNKQNFKKLLFLFE